MDLISRLSPNCNDRAAEAPINMVILHYTGMKTGDEALERLCNAEAEVSAHYLVEEDGRIFQLVPLEKKAWHAGKSMWRGREKCNDYSIGIEIVNPGHEWGYRAFPQEQLDSVFTLVKFLVEKFSIPSWNIVGHSDVAPDRKEDPGELFPWEWFAQKGIGLWGNPDYKKTSIILQPGDKGSEVEAVQSKLAQLGYSVNSTGVYDDDFANVVIAFKRHYCPKQLENHWDEMAQTCLEQLLKQCG